uniref:Histone-lysine N-methyltransferase 2C n=1 Tax=Schistocephalus solidus TaxID=70667 RepID=A0A0X3PPN7_SCHSO
MGRPRRTAPSARSQAWLRLCKNNDSLRKLIPIYFPRKVGELYLTENINNEGSSPSVARASCPIKLRKKKEIEKSKLYGKACEPYSVDEVATQLLHTSVDYQLIRKSLTASPIHWKAMPQFRNLTRKHISAISGSVMQKRNPIKFSNFGMDNRRKVAPSVLKPVDFPPPPPPPEPTSLSVSTVTVKCEPREALSSHDPKEVASTPSSTPTKEIISKPQIFCRYCGVRDNVLRQTFGGVHYICHNCKGFLGHALKFLTRLEDAVCIHVPPCRTAYPVDGVAFPNSNAQEGGTDTSEVPPSPMPSQWCSACRIFRCLQLGFRPSSLKDKRSPHSRLIRNLTITELSQPNLIFRAQERRSLQFWKISHQAWQDAFTKPLEGEQHNQLSSFFDRLWIRAVSLCGHTSDSPTKTPESAQPSEASIESNELRVSLSFQELVDTNGVVAKAETTLCHGKTAAIDSNIETSEVVDSTTDTCSATVVNVTPQCDMIGSPAATMDSFEDLVETSDVNKTETVAVTHPLNGSPKEGANTVPEFMRSEPTAPLEVPSPSKVPSIVFEVASETTPTPAACTVCASLNNLYAVTLGPVDRSDWKTSEDTTDSKAKLSKPQVLLCKKCALRCRMSALKIVSSAKTRTRDTLSDWFRRRNQDGEGSLGCETEPVCTTTEVPSPVSCDTCFLAELLKYFQRVLLPLPDQPIASSKPEDCQAVKPFGSLLFLACTIRPVKPEKKSDWDLFHSQLSENETANARCLICAYAAAATPATSLLRFFRLSTGAVVCQPCLWTYKAVLRLTTQCRSLRSFSCLLDQLNRSPGTERLLQGKEDDLRRHMLASCLDVAFLASMCTAPCLDLTHHQEAAGLPLWAACPPCHSRRCLRLLHPLELPLRSPRWLRRRVRLMLFQTPAAAASVSLNDADPRVSILRIQGRGVYSKVVSRSTLAFTEVDVFAGLPNLFFSPPQYNLASGEGGEIANDPLLSAASTSTGDSDLESDADLKGISSDFSTYSSSSLCSDTEERDVNPPATAVPPEKSAVSADETDEEAVVADEEASQRIPPIIGRRRQRRLTAKAAEALEETIGRRRRLYLRTSTAIAPEEEGEDEEQQEGPTDEDTAPPATTAPIVGPVATPPFSPQHLSPMKPTVSAEAQQLKSPAKSDGPSTDHMDSEQHIEDTSTTAIAEEASSRKRPKISKPQTPPKIIEGKRRPKINTRLRNDFDLNLPAGLARREETVTGVQHSSSRGRRASETTSEASTATSGHRRRSPDRQRLRPESERLSQRIKNRALKSTRSDISRHADGRVSPKSIRSTDKGRRGPRVKQVGRKSIANSNYEKTMSAMVHAAKLAAVGAQTQGGASPLLAASAATAGAQAVARNYKRGHLSRSHSSEWHSDASSDVTRPTSNNSLSPTNISAGDCGHCAACRGLVQPCGRCSDCRVLAHYGGDNSVGRTLQCKDTICFKRRAHMLPKGERPRVKVPSNFSNRAYEPVVQTTQSKRSPTFPSGPQPTPSLLETVPGLQEQLELGTWKMGLVKPSANNGTNNMPSNQQASSASLTSESRTPSTPQLEVFADAPIRSLRGGDLGMHFAPDLGSSYQDDERGTIRPVDGEVIDLDLAHCGGYPVVTTAKSAPPKELCYACGSGGGQLLFCVSCAEPFHFYCVERQFRPRSKDHYVCRNCTACRKCGQLSAELKCIRCSHGFHPSCLPNYAPALSAQRGKWACPDCTHCLHCLVKPTDSTVAKQRTGDVSASMVPWSSDISKCADCNDAEASGQICPECNRAYLRDTLEMVQCDSCRLWRHRTCAKLTVDQYELIAQLSPSQLRPFTIYCSKCKEKTLVRAREIRSTASEDKVNGDERLRCLARDTLLERMQNLVHSCRRSPTHEGSCNTPARRTSQSNGHPPDDGYRVELPQFDGGMDSPEWGGDHQPEVVNMPEPLSDRLVCDLSELPAVASPMCTPTSLPAQAPDGTLTNNSDPVSLFLEKGLSTHCQSPEMVCETVVVTTTHPSDSTSTEEDSFSGAETCVRDDATAGDEPSVNEDADYEVSVTSSSSVGTYRDGDSCRVPAWTVRIDLDPPPMPAAWLTDGDTFEYWTTPRSLAYSLLARLLQRLSCTATTNPEFIRLRRLLQWLVSCVERLFPWMPAGECIDEVRDLLRQAHGSLTKVLQHLRALANSELHELTCPRISGLLEETHSRALHRGPEAHTDVTFAIYETCWQTVCAHLTTYHSEFRCPPSPHLHKMTDLEAFVGHTNRRREPGAAATDVRLECFDPHAEEKAEDLRQETRDERWIEHWSTLEDRIAISNFQKELFLRWQRILIQQRTGATPSPPPAGTIGKPTNLLDLSSLKPFYFALPEYWEALEASYAPRLQQLASIPRNTVDLDESDEEAVPPRLHASKTHDVPSALKGVLPLTVIDAEEKMLADDPRRCLLCARNTDDSIEGRMLYTGSDTWIHVNCALWSNEVYEEDSGQLAGLSAALRRGGMTRCADCGQLGATMTCLNSASPCPGATADVRTVVHFACALRRQPPTVPSVFTADRSWFCSPACRTAMRKQRLREAVRDLRKRRKRELLPQPTGAQFGISSESDSDSESSSSTDEYTDELTACRKDGLVSESDFKSLIVQVDADLERIKLNDLLICRRVFVPSDCFAVSLTSGQPDEVSPVLSLAISPNTVALLKGEVLSSNFILTVGALRVDRLGRIREASDSLARTIEGNDSYLCPIGYRARRIYWSCQKMDARIAYTLNVQQFLRTVTAYHHPAIPITPKPGLLTANPAERRRIDSSSKIVQSFFPKPTTEALRPSLPFSRPLLVQSPLTTGPHRTFSTGWSAIHSLSDRPTTSNSLPKPLFISKDGQLRQPPRTSVSKMQPVSRTLILSPPLKSLTDAPPLPTVFSLPSSHMVSSTVTATFNGAIPLPTSAQPTSVIQNLPPPRLELTEPRPLPQSSSLEHPLAAPRIVSAMSLSTTAPDPGVNIPSFDSVVVSAPKVRILPNAESPIENIVRPLNCAPAEKRTAFHAGLPNTSVSEPKRISLPPTQTNSTMLIATRGGQTVVLRSTKNLTPVQLPTSLGVSAPRPSSLTMNSGHSAHLSGIASPNVAIKLNPVDGTQTAAIVPELGKTLAPPDFHLASQLDGILNSIPSMCHRTADATPAARLLPPSSQPVSAVATIRIPQIAQLDGIDDRGLWPKRSSVSGKNAHQARKGVSVKKKWMIERDNREELKNRINKAKQENCDRLYQRELTTHAESFRLSFSVDNVIKAAATPAAAWGAVLQRVAQLRSQQGLAPLSPRFVDGWTQFGLNHRHVIFLIEQLTNAFTCYRYRFRYHQYQIDRLREMFTPPAPVREGCARAMPCPISPRKKGIARDPLDFLSCRSNPAPHSCLPHEVASRVGGGDQGDRELGAPGLETCLDAAREAASLVANSLNLPPKLHARTVEAAVAQATATVADSSGLDCDETRSRNQFSLTYQLKNLVCATQARLDRVSVHPSRIHKRGLFALRAFRSDELICEYTGELIRNIICDLREVRYQAAGVDCYMFRVDNDWVIDATYAGNFARFINHSCQPNCDAKIVTIGDRGHIAIIAKRRIIPGEELTYDYRFPKEADKLLCNCGRIGCRKYLN